MRFLLVVASPILLALIWVPPASAQETPGVSDSELEEIARFGAQGRAVADIARLGGKVQAEGAGPIKEVIGIDLSGSGITDSDISRLKLEWLPDVRTLDLRGTKVTDAGLASLRKLPKLRTLDLEGLSVTDAGLASLGQLDDLLSLNVARTAVTEEGLLMLLRVRPALKMTPMPLAWVLYFPGGAFDPKDEERDASWSAYLGEKLRAMDEPSLWALSREDREAVTYRFLFAPDVRGDTLAVRLVPAGEKATLTAVRLERRQDGPGRVVARKTVTLEGDDWREFRRRLDEIGFWTLPTDLSRPAGWDGEPIFILHPTSLVMEGVKEGKYHVVDAVYAPIDEQSLQYARLFLKAIELAGISAE
jgi:hypothetical protein